MNTITNLLAACIVAGWIITMAVFSIQNITPVALKVFQFETIKLPIGVLLSFCLSAGFFLGALIPPLFSRPKRASRPRFSSQDGDEFDF